jgi:hypothetical protein
MAEPLPQLPPDFFDKPGRQESSPPATLPADFFDKQDRPKEKPPRPVNFWDKLSGIASEGKIAKTPEDRQAQVERVANPKPAGKMGYGTAAALLAAGPAMEGVAAAGEGAATIGAAARAGFQELKQLGIKAGTSAVAGAAGHKVARGAGLPEWAADLIGTAAGIWGWGAASEIPAYLEQEAGAPSPMKFYQWMKANGKKLPITSNRGNILRDTETGAPSSARSIKEAYPNKGIREGGALDATAENEPYAGGTPGDQFPKGGKAEVKPSLRARLNRGGGPAPTEYDTQSSRIPPRKPAIPGGGHPEPKVAGQPPPFEPFKVKPSLKARLGRGGASPTEYDTNIPARGKPSLRRAAEMTKTAEAAEAKSAEPSGQPEPPPAEKKGLSRREIGMKNIDAKTQLKNRVVAKRFADADISAEDVADPEKISDAQLDEVIATTKSPRTGKPYQKQQGDRNPSSIHRTHAEARAEIVQELKKLKGRK